MKQCERCQMEEGSEDYPFELNNYNGQDLCEECMEEVMEEEHDTN